MRAAVLRTHGEPLEITDVEQPTVDERGALIDVEACGIYRSDWHAWRGDYDRDMERDVFGHEPVGTVLKVGADVESVREGDRVTNCENDPEGFPGAFAEPSIRWVTSASTSHSGSRRRRRATGSRCRPTTSSTGN